MNEYKGLLENKFKVDLTILLQNVNAMEGFMENPMVFYQCIKEIADHFNKIDNPNFNKAISPMAETLFSVLPYGFLCNNNVEFIKNNQKTLNIQNDKAHVLINSTMSYSTYVTQINMR